jgi:hypothetical protein
MIFFLILLFMRRGGESSKSKVEAAASVKLSAFASGVPAESVTRLVSTSLEVFVARLDYFSRWLLVPMTIWWRGTLVFGGKGVSKASQ